MSASVRVLVTIAVAALVVGAAALLGASEALVTVLALLALASVGTALYLERPRR